MKLQGQGMYILQKVRHIKQMHFWSAFRHMSHFYCLWANKISSATCTAHKLVHAILQQQYRLKYELGEQISPKGIMEAPNPFCEKKKTVCILQQTTASLSWE